MKQTDWDRVYLNKPTDLSDKYPDPFGNLDAAEDARVFKIASIIAKIVSTFIGASLIMLLYTGWEWLHP